MTAITLAKPEPKSRRIEHIERKYGVKIVHDYGHNYRVQFPITQRTHVSIFHPMRLNEIKEFCKSWIKDKAERFSFAKV